MMFLKRLLYYLCVSCRPNRSHTVRTAFSFTFAALLFLGAAVLVAEDSSYIKISSDNSAVEKGEFFTIDVYVGAHTAVNAVDIAVSFPKDQIAIDGIDIGESVITIWTQEPYVENNTVYIQGGTFRNGFIGEHLVAQINARAKKSGVAKFTVGDAKLLAGDGRGSTVSIEDTGYESLTMYVAVAGEEGKLFLEGNVKVGIYTDINGDGKVDMNDIMSFMKAWRDQNIKYDFNNDGRMSFVDFAIILAHSFFN